ncbi:MAG: rhodanese-like domain-containing protein [Gammaproteobacteria bacterium]|nr:rhodanese-like domain-containing protein [Gammaproteobacteria bacterium]
MMLKSLRFLFLVAGLSLVQPLTAEESTKWVSPETVAGTETVNLEQAKQLHADGVVFIDVRSPRQYRKRHIDGAINLYIKDRLTEENLLKHVAKDKPFVIYCNGISCSLSYRAAEKALGWNFTQIKYFREGIFAWRRDGNPLAYGDQPKGKS